MVFDELVQNRLGEFGLVGLVVAMAAVAHHVNKNILVELLTVLDGQPACKYHRFRIVAVDVQHGRVHNFGHIGTVNTGPGIVKIGGKAYLVVNHKVNGTSGVVAFQAATSALPRTRCPGPLRRHRRESGREEPGHSPVVHTIGTGPA